MKRLFHLTNNWISSWKGKLTSSYMMRTIKSSLQSFSAAVIVACSISFSGWGGSFVQCKVIGNLEQDFVKVKSNCEYFTPLRSFWEFTLTLKYLLEILWCGTGVCVFNFDLKKSVFRALLVYDNISWEAKILTTNQLTIFVEIIMQIDCDH